MVRPIKLLLSTCLACGILSLLLFYLYTDRYTNRNVVSHVQRTRTIKKAVHIKENWNLAGNKKTSKPNDRPIVTLPTTSSVQEVTITTLLSGTQKPSLNSVNGGDTIDQLIEESLEKNKKRSHSDGDEPEPSKVPEENDIPEEEEEETPSPTSSYNDDTNVEESSNEKSVSSNSENEDENLELCPAKPRSLTGPLFVNQNIPKMSDLEKHISEDFGGWVKKGGAWKPSHCKARVKMALIVPFRKRYEQLAIFVRHMHPMLKRQEIDYRIIIVEQSGRTPFNRAILFNIGYKEALKFKNFNCFIFHDVDLIPEDDRNMYTCPTSPRHMSVAVDKFNYRLPYPSLFGGAEAFLRKDFEEVNGFSNKFWGWGGEDDDLYQRVVSKGHHLSRPSLHIGRYKMIRIHHHQSSKADPNSGARVKNARIRMLRDGLNSLKYKVLKLKEEPMYTMVTVEVNPKDF